ncbi:MAG TPA: MotA/TolQ/ExbB proton channel family protein [bacterium]
MINWSNWYAVLILIVLLLMSVLSWAIIVTKFRYLSRVLLENRHFSSQVQKDQPLANLYTLAQKYEVSPLAKMFEHSYREIAAFRAKVEKQPLPDARERLMDILSRQLERDYNSQTQSLEMRLPLLATISSSAPYIGLFGTVLGIIKSFQDIGVSGVTSLAVVAPGISEALVATAAGLMAAIPALMAYNFFRNRIRDVNGHMKNFALDITNRMEKLL